MADGSDSPEDLVAYHRLLEEGYECAFGSRFVHGARVIDYPRSKLIINRIVNFGIRRALPPRLQRHDQRLQGLPARGDRERPAAALPPLQPHGRAAAEGGRPRLQLRDRADLLDQPQGRRLEARAATRWAAATCSSSSTSSSSTTSAAATTAAARTSRAQGRRRPWVRATKARQAGFGLNFAPRGRGRPSRRSCRRSWMSFQEYQ